MWLCEPNVIEKLRAIFTSLGAHEEISSLLKPRSDSILDTQRGTVSSSNLHIELAIMPEQEEPKAKKAKTEEEEKEKKEEKEEKHEDEDGDEKDDSKPAANGDKKESLFDISTNRRVSVRKFKGKTYIDIREVRRIARYFISRLN